MKKDKRNELEYLLKEYKETRDQFMEYTKDMEAIRDNLIKYFNDNNIKEHLYNGKKFLVYDHKYYKYPTKCKKHKGVEIIDRQYFKMLDKKQKKSTPFQTMYPIKVYYNNQ